jgi:hypothetical protein
MSESGVQTRQPIKVKPGDSPEANNIDETGEEVLREFEASLESGVMLGEDDDEESAVEDGSDDGSDLVGEGSERGEGKVRVGARLSRAEKLAKDREEALAMDFDPIGIMALDPAKKRVLELHMIESMPWDEAYKTAGLEYKPNHSVPNLKRTNAAKAYMVQLWRRRVVIDEFGVDDLSLFRLIRLRDAAEKRGNDSAAVRAHELINKQIAEKLKAQTPKGEGGSPDTESVGGKTREELLARVRELQNVSKAEKPLDTSVLTDDSTQKIAEQNSRSKGKAQLKGLLAQSVAPQPKTDARQEPKMDSGERQMGGPTQEDLTKKIAAQKGAKSAKRKLGTRQITT